MTDKHNSTARRVAFLHSGDRDLAEAIIQSGLEIAYLYDADFGVEHLDFDGIPPFDLVAADGEQQTLEMALLFIRARTPLSFVMVGDHGKIRSRLADLPYHTETKGRTLVGTLPDSDFRWPPGIAG